MAWNIKTLSEICEIQTGKKDVNSGSPDGKFPFFTCAKEHTYSDEYSFDCEALLIAGNGVVGNTSYFKGKFEAYQRTYVLSNFKNTLPRFLFLLLDGILKDALVDKKLGNTMPYIKVGMLKDFPVPLPPIPEQQRIVAILDQAFADIEKARANAEQNLKNASELFDSYLNQVFSQRGEGWNETTLGQEIDLLTGYAFKSKDYTEQVKDVPLIRGDNVVQGKLRWDGVKRWPKERTAEFAKYQLQEGDVVLAMDRTWVKAGMKYAKITCENLPCLLVQRVARLRSLDTIDEDYLFHLLGSKLFERYVLSIQTGLGVPHISGKQIAAFEFQKPSLEQQKEITIKVNLLSKEVRRLTMLYNGKVDSLDELKKSLLQKAFTGELTKNNGMVA
jgi:type I restriction enzyme S subunit